MTAFQVWAHWGIAAWLLVESGGALVAIADEIALTVHVRRRAR
jgi:hypothetical protein